MLTSNLINKTMMRVKRMKKETTMTMETWMTKEVRIGHSFCNSSSVARKEMRSANKNNRDRREEEAIGSRTSNIYSNQEDLET